MSQRDEVQSSPDVVVEVSNLKKTFQRTDGTVVTAIDSTTITVEPGEFVVLLGPSGCGKTTLLRCTAGLEEPNEGEIRIGGRVVYSSRERINIAPEKRALSMIFQSYALWPHMSAMKNVAYPLENLKPRPSRGEIKARVRTVLEMVGIPELINQYPNQMSGGQQQRVALARALVGGSTLVLFDEPLSNVDAKVREQLRHELATMQRELGFAALYVTHDQQEAMQLANRIAVIDRGAIRQLGPPREIYAEPTSRYVANFIGTTNEVEGKILRQAGGTVEVETAIGIVHGRARSTYQTGEAVVALWRPERTVLHASPGAANTWSAELRASVYSGTHTEQTFGVGPLTLRRWTTEHEAPPGGELFVSVAPDDVRVLPADDTVVVADSAGVEPSAPIDAPLVASPAVAI